MGTDLEGGIRRLQGEIEGIKVRYEEKRQEKREKEIARDAGFYETYHAVNSLNSPYRAGFFEGMRIAREQRKLLREVKRRWPKAYRAQKKRDYEKTQEERRKWDRIMEEGRKPCSGGSA